MKKEIIANWKKYDVRKNIRELLLEAIDKNDINIAINEANYTFPKARELSNLIKKYEEIASSGGYIKVPNIDKSLKKEFFLQQSKLLEKDLFKVMIY